MAGSLAEKRQDYAEVLQRVLKMAVSHLLRLPEVKRIIVLGSFAKGRRDLFTDLDLLVVDRLRRASRGCNGSIDSLGGKMGVDFDLSCLYPRGGAGGVRYRETRSGGELGLQRKESGGTVVFHPMIRIC